MVCVLRGCLEGDCLFCCNLDLRLVASASVIAIIAIVLA